MKKQLKTSITLIVLMPLTLTLLFTLYGDLRKAKVLRFQFTILQLIGWKTTRSAFYNILIPERSERVT